MRWIVMMLTIALIANSRGQPMISGDDYGHISKALDALIMTPADAGFEKDIGEPEWALAWITNALTDPWKLPGVAEKIYDATKAGGSAPLISLSAELLEVGAPPAHEADEDLTQLDVSPLLDPVIARALPDYVAVAMRANEKLEAAFEDLSHEQKTYLAASVLAMAFETEDREESRVSLAVAGMPREVQVRVEQEGRQLDGTAVSLAWLEEAKKVDRALLLSALQDLRAAAEPLALAVEQASVWPEAPVRMESTRGVIVIGTKGNDHYDSAALLILDPGGDDVYEAPAGVANGLQGLPVATLIDLAGEDTYRSRELLGPGSACWGMAVLYDAAGDDAHHAGYIGGGAALFGASWLEDAGGDDAYRAQAFGQGAATVGFGFHIDSSGHDRYEIGFYGQGFAGVMGCGWLLDRRGHDRYFAGNVRVDHERNPDRFLALAQGFSIGMRPHAGGGVGALVDLDGNDHYIADVYGQGVSYYYSAGFLIDAAGHDSYQMYQYGQGCGIHLSHGLLADLAGNDTYAGFILSQGSAHDYAVGMLVDHAGNDTYTGDHHTQGRALNNAFALLLDRAGDDGYFARQREGGQGIGNNGGFRDYGSLALMLDLGGADIYSGGFSNAAITLRPLYGVVYDHE